MIENKVQLTNYALNEILFGGAKSTNIQVNAIKITTMKVKAKGAVRLDVSLVNSKGIIVATVASHMLRIGDSLTVAEFERWFNITLSSV